MVFRKFKVSLGNRVFCHNFPCFHTGIETELLQPTGSSVSTSPVVCVRDIGKLPKIVGRAQQL